MAASTYAQTTRYFVYVTNTVGNNVSAYAMNPSSGAISVVGGSPFAAGMLPREVAIATVTSP